MKNLVVSLTTIHSRINKIHHVITSLLSQDVDIKFEVRLYISEEPYLLDKGIQEIPEELARLYAENSGKFSILKTTNIGPYRKFIPVLKEFYNDELNMDFLVTVDDDTVYPDSWLRKLVNEIQKRDCVIAYRGRQISCDATSMHRYKKWKHSNDDLLEPSILTVGTGKDGIIYKPDFFHPDVIDVQSALAVCNHADDLWLKVHTAMNGVSSMLLSSSLNEAFQDMGENDENTLYKQINKFGGNDAAMSNLIDYCWFRYRLNLLDVFNLNTTNSSSWFNERFLKSFM